MSLKKKVFTGVKWVTVANISRQILSMISIIILARLLSPEDFGTYAILMIFVTFLTVFRDMGTTAVLIHIPKPSSLLLSSVFYLNLSIGVGFSIILTLLAPAISAYFETPKLEEMLQFISLIFIISSLAIVQKALFQKNMDFKQISIIETISLFLGIFAGILSAFYGLGVYSLIIQSLLTSLIDTTLVYRYSSWYPSTKFSFGEIKKIWKYSANLSAFEFMNYFSTNADNFLIGKYLSSSALGIYSVAYKIMLYPLQNISRTLMRVLFPAFSTIKDDNQRFKKAYLRVIFFISLVSFPLMIGLIVTSDVFVNVLFGDKWIGLVTLLIILAPSGMLRSIFTTVGPIYTAKGNTDIQFKLGAVNSILTIIGFVIGLSYGVNGVAFAYLMVNTIMLYPIFKISWRQIDLSVSEGIGTIFPILIISLLMGFGIYLFDIALLHTIENQIIRLILMVAIGIVLYYILLKLKYKKLKQMIKI
jgi:PST family polysaccharide transporter